MVHPGFLEWATSIRLIMANDPGRQFFLDQVQNHGFLFLEDYLGNILAGPKRDPLIELVKTPGRKRGRKNKRSTVVKSKSKKTARVAQEDDIEKENAPPDTFYQTLLQAKRDLLAETDSFRNLSSEPAGGKYTRSNEQLSRKLEKLQDIVIPYIQIEDESTTTSIHPSPPSRESQHTIPISNAVSLGPPVVEPTDLSVIAEGDEFAECSHTSIHITSHSDIIIPPAQNSSTSHVAESTADLASNKDRKRKSANHDSISSTDTFHSANLSPPATTQGLHGVPPPPSSAGSRAVEITTSPAAIPTSAKTLARPLPEIPLERPITRHETVTERPPFPPADFTAESTLPLRNAEAHTHQVLTHKKSIPTLPILPVPIPPPKTMRPMKDSSSSTTVTSTMASGNVLGGKRSSWLIKAREAKAMEDTTKKFIVLGVPASGPVSVMAELSEVPGTLKRKSGESSSNPATVEIGEDRGNRKVAKLSAGDVASATLNAREGERQRIDAVDRAAPQVTLNFGPPVTRPKHMDLEPAEYLVPMQDDQDGILNRLKKTVEGLGARVGKSMGKSLGGATAASLLAEARAAAEARVVKREIAAGSKETDFIAEDPSEHPMAYSGDHSRLSLSDLASAREKQAKGMYNNEMPMRFPSPPIFLPQPLHTATIPNASKTSTSTTPPNSPPQDKPAINTLPIFRGSPVFIPPKDVIAPSRKDVTNKPLPTFSFVPPGPTFSSAPAPASARPPNALSAQSTLESVASGSIFDAHEDVPAWMPTTQDTEYSSVYDSQPQVQHRDKNKMVEDDDDSWPLDEGGPIWNFVNTDADDSWSDMNSVAPSPMDAIETIEQPVTGTILPPSSQNVPGTFDSQVNQEFEEEYLGLDESDQADMVKAGLSTVSLVDSKGMSRSESQLSTASSSSNLGFLGQASKFVGSVLGAGKKGKTEVKSLQRAAIAAKKQQEEMDKKAARLKEMENRRQRALQRKAEEEKTRVMELEKKIKAESERRKREREENTDKKPIRPPTEKDDDSTKKRKVVVEIDKKLTKKASANVVKVGPPSKNPHFSKQLALTPHASTINASQPKAPSSTAKIADLKTIKTPALKITVKGHGHASGKEDIDPIEAVQAQMSARVKKQMQAGKQGTGEHEVPSESIELPDINSDYSDSGDERPPGAFNPPVWAQSPELREALHMQSTLNPDEIFGAVRPLRMEEIFRARTSRFRARTSSANWAGPDGLTIEEEREYARRMGYR